jgi:hypothetical protein
VFQFGSGILQAIWGCLPEFSKDCQDMTNSSSTYFSIIAGAMIGAAISWWIYYRQKKTAELQDAVLERIEELNERHDRILESIRQIEQRHQNTLDTIQGIERQVKELLERNDGTK